nr:unnamed protein product [Digitaria exilis]
MICSGPPPHPTFLLLLVVPICPAMAAPVALGEEESDSLPRARALANPGCEGNNGGGDAACCISVPRLGSGLFCVLPGVISLIGASACKWLNPEVAEANALVARSNEVSSRVILTDAPHEDGYAWRKYDEKKINGTHFTRNYFRCSYKYDRGCQATKQIQQQSGNDMPMFQVTYISEHTCNCTTSANKYSQGDLPQLSYFNTDGRIISLDHAMIKQEQKRLLPPLDELSTVFLDSTSFCQEPVPINMTITDDGTPDFQSESRDGFIDLGQMLLPLEPLEDNPFNDSEFDVLFNCMLQN